jgi:hypothetical protein
MHRARLARDAGVAATVGAGVGVAEVVGQLFEAGGEGALSQSACRLLGDFLQSGEVGSQARSFLPESPAGNNFSPLCRQLADILEVLGVQGLTRHSLPSLALADINGDARFLSLYHKALSLAKQVLASRQGEVRTRFVHDEFVIVD